jgi:hypothetical protein
VNEQTISPQKEKEVDPLALTQEKSDLYTVTDEDSGKDSIQFTENFQESGYG